MDTRFLLIEPYYGGSHKQFMDQLMHGIKRASNQNVCLVTLPPKKWHWRARTSALYLSQIIPSVINFKVLFASSVLNLAELLALRPDLSSARKIVYFHENQLIYPVKDVKQRDFQYGYNQILTCMVADFVVFNSNFNKDSFLNNIKKFLSIQPDFRPKGLKEQIEKKCSVLYFPIAYPLLIMSQKDNSVLHIIWPHRREHDKNPELFFQTLHILASQGKKFKFSILGESFTEEPPGLKVAREGLSNYVQCWGFVEAKETYYEVLKTGHVAVSTSRQEFFGVAMLEATYCGCFPLCPNRLVYPEIYPKECLYDDDSDLLKKLSDFCDNPLMAVNARSLMSVSLASYSADHALPKIMSLFFY